MAQDKKTRKRRPKPLLAAAVFCDRILERIDGTMSAINVTDSYIAFIGPDALVHPDQRIPISRNVFLAFKSGDVVGERIVKLVLRIPTGRKQVVFERSLPFKGGEQGVNIKVNFELKVKTQGVYWMDVIVDGTRLTRMPLKIMFQSIEQLEQMVREEQPHGESS
jgi:hypothetical protein